MLRIDKLLYIKGPLQDLVQNRNSTKHSYSENDKRKLSLKGSLNPIG